jgi:methionyl-tRNA formyltransferase
MNIVFLGTMEFAVPILQMLHEEHFVSLVVTQPDRPFGRKQILKPSPVKERAMALGIPVFQPESIKSNHRPILEQQADVMIVAAYGQMIPNILLETPPYKAINVHASLLPKYRGGAPMHKAIQNGENETGVTVMFMASKMDSGPILSQRMVPILPSDNVGTLQTKLALAGANLLRETLPKVFDRTILPIEQDPSQVTFAYNIKPNEEWLSFDQTMKEVCDHVRGYNPWPVVRASIRGVEMKIHEVEAKPYPIERFGDAKNGEVVLLHKNEVFVKVKDGLIRLAMIQPAGKSPMAASSYVNGAGREILAIGAIFDRK